MTAILHILFIHILLTLTASRNVITTQYYVDRMVASNRTQLANDDITHPWYIIELNVSNYTIANWDNVIRGDNKIIYDHDTLHVIYTKSNKNDPNDPSCEAKHSAYVLNDGAFQGDGALTHDSNDNMFYDEKGMLFIHSAYVNVSYTTQYTQYCKTTAPSMFYVNKKYEKYDNYVSEHTKTHTELSNNLLKRVILVDKTGTYSDNEKDSIQSIDLISEADYDNEKNIGVASTKYVANMLSEHKYIHNEQVEY